MASTQNRHATGTSTLARLFASPLWAELRRLLLLGAATYLLIALLTYSPQDPSWSTWSSRGDLRNWMGRAGSIIADLLFQGFGLSAFAAVALMALGVFKRPTERPPAKISLAFFVLSLSFVFQCVLPTSWSIWDLQNPGGVAGNLLRRGASYVTGDLGALMVSVIALLAAFIIVFRVPIVSWFLQLIPKLLARAQAAQKAWAARIKAEWEVGKQKILAKKAAAAKPVTPIASGVAAGAASALPAPTPTPMPAKSSINANAAAHLPLAEKAEKDEEISKLALAGRVKKVSTLPRIERPVNQDFTLPGLEMLSGKAEAKTKTVDRSWYLEKAEILVQKLKDFGVEGEVVHISPGPVITVYEFKPASGVKIKEIANLSDDLTLALSVMSVRIVAPIPGKPVVGIEIPSPHREMVFFKDMIQETDFYNPEVKIPIVLGRLASGEPVVTGLASMPHLLVAGSTGTGKSVFINTLITSLLYRYSPRELKLVLVDPKMVELSMYEGVPHLLLPVVIDSKKAALALRWAVDEMERRYALLHQLGVRHLTAYNDKVAEMGPNAGDHAFMPYIVVVIDEYADLMAVVAKDVELSIARLAQKARASGIHLVLATQRPSTDVVTGTIKANFPSRISFRVASSVDSKTILDRTGADRLLGNGDLLFHTPGFSTLKRMQGAFLSDSELERVVNFLKAQGEPEYDERLLQAQEAGEGEPSFDDESGSEGGGANLYDQAVRLVAEKGEASISLIQRHLKIGYNRAASLMEEMEKQGIVAPASGTSKRRAVLINSI